MTFRDRLKDLDASLYGVFVSFTEDIAPVLTSIERVLPDFTRHDPSHSEKLESIALEILAPSAAEQLTAEDIFALLCALWLHDAGMGEVPEIEQTEKASPAFREKLTSYQRLGQSEQKCWQDYVRDRHPFFCPLLAEKFLPKQVPPHLVRWIGRIAQSHGEQTLHDRQKWPSRVAVGNRVHIHAPALGVLLRLADILHFNYERAPEYMFEHRRVSNWVSINHWKAHQVASDYTIEHDLCRFDGSTIDDEAYWFALQFLEAMDIEVRYCKQEVLPTLDDPFRGGFLSFSRVENRIEPVGFEKRREPVTLRVDTPKILEDLLNDSLYAGRPTWFREALQNAFDACRDCAALDLASQPSVRIKVQSDPEVIYFEDLGVGMQPKTVENFLFVAGASYWTSQEYRSSVDQPPGHVGRFGIGFMSLFAVAEEIQITTRHLRNDQAWQYLVRGPRRVIRVEAGNRPFPGTTIEVRLKKGTLLANDILELFDSTCSFPEFPLELIVDGVVERSFPEPTPPSTLRGDIELASSHEGGIDARLLKRDLSLQGVVGDYYLPKIYVPQLRAFIPDMRQWLKNLGWSFGGQSQTYFGGINYPPLYSVSAESGFTTLPSLGCLRIAVSPNEYPLEMNLARDQFISGESTRLLHRALCEWLDGVLTSDLETELSEKQDSGIRAAIVARWSWTMLHSWQGSLPEPATILNGLRALPAPFPLTPWPRMTALMRREVRFGCIDRDGSLSVVRLEDLVQQGARVYAGGLIENKLSDYLAQRVFERDPEAHLLLVLPDREFGILELRYWASDEFLIPIPEHARCAYGLQLGQVRLGEPGRPFPFFPRELDYLGYLVASGPEEYAVLDYRGIMAEAKLNPFQGGPQTVGFFNRRNSKAQTFIRELRRFSDTYELRRSVGQEAKRLKKALTFGENGQYGSHTRRCLVEALNSLCERLDLGILFGPDDFPFYFDGGRTLPFGFPGIESRAAQAATALDRLENRGFTLS